LQKFGDALTSYEKDELRSCSEVFYTGHQAQKIQASATDGSNCGFDDEAQHYRIVPGDHINYRYEVLGLIGSGTFSNAVKCMDHKMQCTVVIKVVRNDQYANEQSALELDVLRKFAANDPQRRQPVCWMYEHFTFRHHLCIVFEQLDVPLNEYITQQGGALQVAVVRSLARQLLTAICFMSRLGFIHSDIKPENILMCVPRPGAPPLLKLIDFNSSTTPDRPLMLYIQTRFYRCPEVLLGGRYGHPIDMWSFGCILVEMLTGSPLFPGINEVDQLACIMEVCGAPPAESFHDATQTATFFNPDGSFIGTKQPRGAPGSLSLKAKLFPLHDDVLIDLLAATLRWEPLRRLTPNEALHHKWFVAKQPPRITPVPRGRRTPIPRGFVPNPDQKIRARV